MDAALGPGSKLDIKVEMNSVEALIELAKDGGLPTVLADRSLGSRKDLAVVPFGPPWNKRPALCCGTRIAIRLRLRGPSWRWFASTGVLCIRGDYCLHASKRFRTLLREIRYEGKELG